MNGNVGEMRYQSALVNADTPIQVVSKDPEVARLLAKLHVVSVYPDTTDAHGNWTGTFKIELAKE